MSDSSKQEGGLLYRLTLSGIKGIVKILIMVCLLIALIALGRKTYELGYAAFNEKPVDQGEGRAVTVTVREEMSVYDIGRMLRREGVLNEDPMAFVLQEMISGYHNKLLPGEYVLRTSMVADDIFPILAQAGEDNNTGKTAAPTPAPAATNPVKDTEEVADQIPEEAGSASESASSAASASEE